MEETMSPHRLAPRTLVALGATVALSAPMLAGTANARAAGATCADTSTAAVEAPAATAARAVRCLVNGQRRAQGLKPLRPSRQLRIAAERHGTDMVSHGFFAHVSPVAGDITDRARAAGYLPGDAYGYDLGEDIGWGEGPLSSPDSIVTAWMNSPGHRAVILGARYRDMGVGVTMGLPAQGELAGATFVLDLGAHG
jgi:uncharacterized protein YkwD